ncbi:MAG: hypothetical protein HQM02_05155 [Magnetococcales bacterium]|nr:hypothetical protein [Magnetococcales bacterium]
MPKTAIPLLFWLLLFPIPSRAGDPPPLRTERLQPQAIVTPGSGQNSAGQDGMAQIQFHLSQGHRILDAKITPPPQGLGEEHQHERGTTTPDDRMTSGYILHAGNGRPDMSRGEEVFIHYPTPLPSGATLDVLRPGPVLRDPDTREPLGHLTFRLGSVRIHQTTPQGTTATVTTSLQTLHAGDRLALPSPVNTDFTLHTQAPNPLSGRIIHIQDNLTEVGAGHVVVVNLGRQHRGVQGLTLPVYRARQHLPDPTSGKTMEIPEKRIGTAILFHIGSRASFAMLENTLQPVRLGDTIRTP